MRTRRSAANAPVCCTSTGFMSSSCTSGASGQQLRDTRSRTSRNAASSAGGAPRKPRSSRAPRSSSTMSAASTVVKGCSRNEVSCIRSTSTPPVPQAMSGPNNGSWTAPTIISTPPRTIAWTSGRRHLVAEAVARNRHTPRRTSSSSARFSATARRSVLCSSVGPMRLQDRRVSHRPCRGNCLVHARDDLRGAVRRYRWPHQGHAFGRRSSIRRHGSARRPRFARTAPASMSGEHRRGAERRLAPASVGRDPG